MELEIATLPLGAGTLALCPMPGRGGALAGDVARLLDWRPDLVISLVSEAEFQASGATGLGGLLHAAGVGWRHLPIADFSVPDAAGEADWPKVSAEAHAVLARGGRVLAHCHGGCGRSGMVALRLMVEAGEAGEAALERLRAVRPCAVETAAQRDWATG